MSDLKHPLSGVERNAGFGAHKTSLAGPVMIFYSHPAARENLKTLIMSHKAHLE
jgi:hypothetical protein